MSLALLAASAPSLGQTSCQLPPNPKAVGDLATANPTLGVNPQWNGVSVGMIPSAQPITLRLIFPTTFDKTTPIFKIAGKLDDDAWLDFPMKDWKPANDNKSGDLVLEPVPDNRLSPVPFTQLQLVVVACASDQQLVGRTDALISLRWLDFVGAFAITALFYVLGALSLGGPGDRGKWLNPLWMALDGSGRASLAQMQIIFFSVIVLFLVCYILLRTGILASLFNDVLLLLGIAAIGSLGRQLATDETQRVSFENWSWLKRKHWLVGGGFHVDKPQWSVLFSTNDIFHPYRFQMVSFSFVIGVSLLMIGLTGLANFTIPTSLLGIIGLSQVTYIGGKITPRDIFRSRCAAHRAAQGAGRFSRGDGR